MFRRKLVESAKESIRRKASNLELYEMMQDVFLEMDMKKMTNKVATELEDLKNVVLKDENDEKNGKQTFDPEIHIDTYLPVCVYEQRLSNLLQSIFLMLSFFAMPAIKRFPSSLLWGYFAYMAIDSLPGNQFWERIKLLFVYKTRLHKILERDHVSYVDSVPLKVIGAFTIFQLLYMLICYGMTWIPIVGIIFPLPFFVLIIIRHLILPRYFDPHNLNELDALEYEEVVGASKPRHSLHWMSLSFSFRENGTPNFGISEEDVQEVISDSEIFDELTTNRGELKIRTVSFRSERWDTSCRKELQLKSMSSRYDGDKHLNVICT